MTDERPFKLRNYLSGPKEPEAIENEVSKMLKNNVISASQSPYSSPVLLVTKKDGTIRFCVDYRKLNSLTQKDAYNLPRIDDILDQIGGSKFRSTLDLTTGYWQIPMHPESKGKTAFTTRSGLY